jgi:hypothetical protein
MGDCVACILRPLHGSVKGPYESSRSHHGGSSYQAEGAQ